MKLCGHFRYEVKAKKKKACINEIAADIAARFLSRQGRVQSGELSPKFILVIDFLVNRVLHGGPV